MKLAALSLVSFLGTALAYAGDMTYYETGKQGPDTSIRPFSMTTLHPPNHSCLPTEPNPRSRLLRLHQLRQRLHRRSLRPDDEQPRQPQ